MKTRRENLIEAGVPAEELALVKGASVDLDKETTGKASSDLRRSFAWPIAPQEDSYWHAWSVWLRNQENKPGPSGCVPETGQEQPAEQGTNRYGLDVSYFRKAIDRELGRDLSNHRPDELARVFARLSRAADADVMNEPEFRGGETVEPTPSLREVLEAIQRLGRTANYGVGSGDKDIVLRYIKQTGAVPEG